VDYKFKSNKKLSRDILDLLDKSEAPDHYGIPLANLQKGLIRDFVPASNPGIPLKLLHISSGNPIV
jgi:hypothetical protein